MKKCPRCKKDVDDNDKVCPHCGYHLKNEFKPIKNSGNQSMLIALVVLVMFFAPVLFSYFFNTSTPASTTSYMPNKQITLKKLKDVKVVENIYLFDSLDEFNKRVSNVDKYVENIKDFENKLKDKVSKYSDAKVVATYRIYITNENNIRYILVYDIVDSNQTMSLRLDYDLAGKVDDASIKYFVNNFKDFKTMKINDQSYPMFKDVVTLLDDDKKFQLFNDSAKEFNKLEDKFKDYKDYLGNYGLGISKDKDDKICNIRVLSGDKYTLKIHYQTKINLKKFN